MSFQELIHIAAVSGGILYVITFLLLVGLTIIVDRTWYLAKIVRQGELIALILRSVPLNRPCFVPNSGDDRRQRTTVS